VQQQSHASCTQYAHLSERVATLEAQNETLRLIHRDQAARSKEEQHVLQERMEEGLKREAAFQGQFVAAEREKELLLKNAAARLLTQEHCLREYQQQLELALADKLQIERRMAGFQAGCPGSDSGGGDVDVRYTENVFDRARPQRSALDTAFTHCLPSYCAVQELLGANRAAPERNEGVSGWHVCSGSLSQEAAESKQRVTEASKAHKSCSEAHTFTSETLLANNQMLCSEVLRLRQELASYSSSPLSQGQKDDPKSTWC
jgi:hypothetical protein